MILRHNFLAGCTLDWRRLLRSSEREKTPAPLCLEQGVNPRLCATHWRPHRWSRW